MQLTRQADYAARAVVYLAASHQAQIKEIAKAQQVPQEFLAKILQKLVEAGITSSTRGIGGGFRLARPPEDISLLDVIEAIEGSVALNRCLVRPGECPRVGVCSIHEELREIQESLRQKLAAVNFLTLAQREKDLQLK